MCLAIITREKKERAGESTEREHTYTDEYTKAVVEGSSGIVTSLDTMLSVPYVGAISCNLVISKLRVFNAKIIHITTVMHMPVVITLSSKFNTDNLFLISYYFFLFPFFS